MKIMKKNDYWKTRMANSQNKLSDKNRKEIDKQMKKYFGSAMNKVIADFENTYNKLLATQAEGKEVTPADLYKLDKYWEAQAQMRIILEKLGDKQISLLSKKFELNFFDVYYSINIEGHKAFNTIDSTAVNQLINKVWVADGKSWSQRVWDNTELLASTLNDELVSCVVAGKSPSKLKEILMYRFSVSYSNADALVRTELAHIQTQAAQQRYRDYGIKEMEILVDPDERTCEVCGKLHGKKYLISSQAPIPAHPRCRCCIVPVVE